MPETDAIVTRLRPAIKTCDTTVPIRRHADGAVGGRNGPETGRKALYVHPTKCQYIEGMTPDASRALIDDLLETAIKPEFVYRHRWRVGDVLIFDNRCAVHKAHGDYDRQETRLLYRIILRGDRPF